MAAVAVGIRVTPAAIGRTPDAADLTMAWRCRLQWAKGDLNPHPLTGTWPSTMRVCLFRHSPLLTPSTMRVCLYRHSDVVHLGAGGL
jgi:hypothetical protein